MGTRDQEHIGPLPPPVPPPPQEGPRPLICLDPNEFQGDETWHLDEILREFVEGFRFLLPLKREVTFFGSARIPAGDPWYHEAEKLGRLLTERGYTVITGGGPGIMEAANKGALEGCQGTVEECSVGIDINLPEGERRNPYVRKRMAFDYFFTRKVMLSASAQAYVFFPGGFGTLDEMTEIATLVQTKKMEKISIICIGKTFWEPFREWMRTFMIEHDPPLIDAFDLEVFTIVDSAEEALPIIEQSKERKFF
ncbi:MAG: hypothetical protein G01um101438_495 [Parcubacteria group bacterium Gr01-1014_38]|nr:MAG: hypothetical protein G01um101438_495 [Parcubacteria group bacterium Gr01-1014_38]